MGGWRWGTFDYNVSPGPYFWLWNFNFEFALDWNIDLDLDLDLELDNYSKYSQIWWDLNRSTLDQCPQGFYIVHWWTHLQQVQYPSYCIVTNKWVMLKSCNKWQLIMIGIIYHQQVLIDDCHQWVLIVLNECWLSSMSVDHHQWVLIVINNGKWWWLMMIDYYWLMMIDDDLCMGDNFFLFANAPTLWAELR